VNGTSNGLLDGGAGTDALDDPNDESCGGGTSGLGGPFGSTGAIIGPCDGATNPPTPKPIPLCPEKSPEGMAPPKEGLELDDGGKGGALAGAIGRGAPRTTRADIRRCPGPGAM
jgi:hypothetical protein